MLYFAILYYSRAFGSGIVRVEAAAEQPSQPPLRSLPLPPLPQTIPWPGRVGAGNARRLTTEYKHACKLVRTYVCVRIRTYTYTYIHMRAACVRAWVGGWVGGRVDGWMGGWVDGWMGGWVDGRMGGWVDGWMDVYIYVYIYVFVYICT